VRTEDFLIQLFEKIHPMKLTHLVAPFCSILLLAGCAGIDRTERAALTQRNVSPTVYDRMMRRELLSIGDIAELSQRQVPPEVIIRYLRSSRAVYFLDKDALARLHQAKVHTAVLDYMLSTPSYYVPPAPCYYGAPGYPYGYYPAPTVYPYVVMPAPAIYVGARWRWR